MKKKGLYAIVLLLMICFTKTSVKLNKDVGNDLFMQNVEALSDPDVQDVQKTKICWTTLTYDLKTGVPSSIMYCGSCSEMPYTHKEDQLVCKIKKQ